MNVTTQDLSPIARSNARRYGRLMADLTNPNPVVRFEAEATQNTARRQYDAMRRKMIAAHGAEAGLLLDGLRDHHIDARIDERG